MKKAAMFVTDGFEEIEAVGTFAILRRGGVEVDVYSLLDKGCHGSVWPDLYKPETFFDFDGTQYDALVLPGGPEYKAIEASKEVRAYIRDFWTAEKTGLRHLRRAHHFGACGLSERKTLHLLHQHERGFRRRVPSSVRGAGWQFDHRAQRRGYGGFCVLGAGSPGRRGKSRGDQTADLLRKIRRLAPQVKSFWLAALYMDCSVQTCFAFVPFTFH